MQVEIIFAVRFYSILLSTEYHNQVSIFLSATSLQLDLK